MICEYKTLILDMYGVIIEESRDVFLSYVYSKFPESEQDRIKKLIDKDRLYDKAFMGLIDTEVLFASLGFQDHEAAIKEYVSSCLTLDKHFIEFAEKAIEKYELVLLSNDLSELNGCITERFGLDRFFKDKIISADVKCRKPNLEIFDITLEKIGRKPSECIFVDNRPKNLLAAEEVGISTILFNRDDAHHDGMTVYSFKEIWDIIG